jgi:hypothetical protein
MFRRDLSTGIRHCDLRFLDTTRNNNSRGLRFLYSHLRGQVRFTTLRQA